MGTFRWRRRRNLFHCGVVIPWPFLVLLIHGKAVRFTLVGGVEAAPVSGELFLWPFLGMRAEAARCPAIRLVHFTPRHPRPSFVIAENQISRWPATTSPFPNRGTSSPWHFPEIHLWRKKGMILIKEIGWVSNKAQTERQSMQKWQPRQSWSLLFHFWSSPWAQSQGCSLTCLWRLQDVYDYKWAHFSYTRITMGHLHVSILLRYVFEMLCSMLKTLLLISKC